MLVKHIAPEHAEKKVGDVLLEELARAYTEERADEVNAALVALLPSLNLRVWKLKVPAWVLAGAIRKALDAGTPDLPLKAMRVLLSKLGLASSERQMHPGNPFR